MTKFKIYLLICSSIVMLSVSDVQASAEAGKDPRDDTDTRTASSASSSSDTSKDTHADESADKLSQEAINKLVAKTSVEAYAKINQNWHYAKPRGALTTKSTLWEAKYYMSTTNDGGENKTASVPTLVLKDGIDLGTALIDSINKPAELECTIALSTVKAIALKAILGNKLFERYVKAFKKITRKLGYTKEDLLHEVCLPLMTIEHGVEAVPGTVTYITNVSDYSSFKPNGNARGSNVVKVSDDGFIGFSACYHARQTSLAVIEAQDLRLFSDTIDVECEIGKHASYAKLFNDKPDLFVKLRRQHQTKVQFCDYFDAAKIQRFISKGEIEINGEVYQ